MRTFELPVTVTPSRVELGKRCYRRHAIADVLGYGLFTSAAAEFGSVIHAGASSWWKTLDSDKVREAISGEWFKRFESGKQISQDKVSLQLAHSIMRDYMAIAELAGPFTKSTTWQIVTIEERLCLPLDTESQLTFQLDRLLFNKDENHLVLVDTKTAAKLDKRWERQWDLSLQMKQYVGAIKARYEIENVDVVIEGVLKDIPSEIRYYVCPQWSKELLDEAMTETVNIADEDRLIFDADDPIEFGLRTGTNPQDCYSYGFECAFKRLCLAEPSERKGILLSDYSENEEEYF